jgi:glc operon protein GlcG
VAVFITVVDSAGDLIVPKRMDVSTMLASVDLAHHQAPAAALFVKPTKALEDATRAGRSAATSAGFVEMAGGQPLLIDDAVVRAIGISSARLDWETLADAGAQPLGNQFAITEAEGGLSDPRSTRTPRTLDHAGRVLVARIK